MKNKIEKNINKEIVKNAKETVIKLNLDKEIKLEDLSFMKTKKEDKNQDKDKIEVTMEDLTNEFF